MRVFLFSIDLRIVAASALTALTAVAAVVLGSRKPWLSRLRRKPLLIGNEAEFFHWLERSLPAFHVFPQVSFAAFLNEDGTLASTANGPCGPNSIAGSRISSSVIGERSKSSPWSS